MTHVIVAVAKNISIVTVNLLSGIKKAEKDLHITNAILNYITTDINNASIDTVKVIKSK